MEFVWFISSLVLLNAVVSFGIAAFVRWRGLGILASVAVTELMAALYSVARGADSPYPDMALLAVSCIAIYGTPVVLASSVGFVLLAGRLYRRRTTASRA
jgi:hypothetical protein